MRVGDTCESLTEKLKPLYDEYGEEQIIASLRDLLTKEAVQEDDDSFAFTIKKRANDLDLLNDE